ncbi:MAG: peptidoglycan-binding protein [Clostridia bacterium]|nr:peptidoglycan-binding protein [Clostridia bacterium]
MHHVGVYIGDGKVIESIGRDYGVVERDIDASGKDYWNRYGRFTALQKANDESEVLNIALTSPLTRGEAVKSLQERLISLGYDVGKTGADGIYGKNTESAVKLFQERAKKLDYGIYDDNMRLLLGL